MARVAAPFGVKGWIKVQPFTEQVDGLCSYTTWWLGSGQQWQPRRVTAVEVHGKTVVAQLDGLADRDDAFGLKGMEIAVPRSELPAADEDAYYWADLIGMTVINAEAAVLGEVTGLLETGAHDVLRVAGDRERLIPFVRQIVRQVDPVTRQITVDWELDY